MRAGSASTHKCWPFLYLFVLALLLTLCVLAVPLSACAVSTSTEPKRASSTSTHVCWQCLYLYVLIVSQPMRAGNTYLFVLAVPLLHGSSSFNEAC